MSSDEKIFEILEQMQRQLDRIEENQAVIEYELSEAKTRQGDFNRNLKELQRDQTIIKQWQSKIQLDCRDIREAFLASNHEKIQLVDPIPAID